MLSVLAVANYRSLRQLIMPLARLNLVTGPNGSGKSNLYRALRLLADTAATLVPPLAGRAGGLAGVGPGGHVRDGPVGLSDAVVGGRREEALGPGPLGRCGFHERGL